MSFNTFIACPGNCSVTLNWNFSDASIVNNYIINYNSNGQYGYPLIIINNPTQTSHTVTELTNGTIYSFIITANCGEPGRSGSFTSSSQNINSTPIASPVLLASSNHIPAPQNLQVVAVGSETVSLIWNAVSNITCYYVLYGTNRTSLSYLSSPSTNRFIANGLNPDTTYYFAVKAVVNSCSSSQSNIICITTQPHCHSIGCYLADSKVLTDTSLISIQLLKKGDLIQTLNHGLLPVKFVGKRSFFNKLTEERMNAHLYKLNKNDFPELFEDLFITGGHPLLIDEKNLDEETKKKLLDMIDYGTPIITEGKYRVFALIHPKSELWNNEGDHEIFDIVLESDNPKKNYGIWVNGMLTESMDEDYFLNRSGMTEINTYN
jgi:hypothetical protein